MPSDLVFSYASKKYSTIQFYKVEYYLKKINLTNEHAKICEIINVHNNNIKKDKFEAFLHLKSSKTKPFVFISCLN